MMQTKIKVLTSADVDVWMSYIARAKFHDIYQYPGYHQAVLGKDESFICFVAEAGNDFLAFPAIKRPLSTISWLSDSREFDLGSVYGYPGPFTSSDDDAINNALVQEMLAFAKDAGFISWTSRLHPLGKYACLTTSTSRVKAINQTVYIDLSQTADEIFSAMSQNHRRDIQKLKRRGAQLVAADYSTDIAAFSEDYFDTMRRNSAAESYFFDRAYFDKLKEYLGEHVRLFSITAESGDVLARALCFLSGDIVQYHLGAVPTKHLKESGLKLLFHELALWAKEQNYRYLHLGGGFSGSDTDGLFGFKKGFSEQRGNFSLFEAVLNPARNEELNRLRTRQSGGDAQGSYYFPAYRQPVRSGS